MWDTTLEEAHRQIHGVDVFRERAHGDVVHAGFGNRADLAQVDATGCFELGMAANLQQQGMKQEDIKLSPDLFRPQAEDRVALGLVLNELVRTEHLQAKPEQVKAMVQETAQTYEQPEAVVRWHYDKPERLADFEALAVEHNVIEWVLGKAQVKDTPMSFEALMGPARAA